MKTSLHKIIILVSFFQLGLTDNTGRQISTALEGKYCEDLGFGWHCIEFQAKGKCEITSGHSYWINRCKGKWTIKNDTIMLIRLSKKKIKKDTSFYYYQSDTLYEIHYHNKRAIRLDEKLIKLEEN